MSDAEDVGMSVDADVGSALEDTVAVGHDEAGEDEVGETEEEAVCVSATEDIADGDAVSALLVDAALVGDRPGEAEALAEKKAVLDIDAEPVKLLDGLVVEHAECVPVPLAVPNDEEEAEGLPEKDALEVPVGEPEEEAEWDPVALAVSVDTLDAVARPVVELEPVPVVAPDGVEEAEGEPEKDALEVPVGEPEAEAVKDAKAVPVGWVENEPVPVPVPVSVPVLLAESVEMGVKEEKGELLGVEIPEEEPVASRVVANGVEDPRGETLAVSSGDCDEEEERQRVAEKTRVVLSETVTVGVAAVEADVLEEGEGALVMPGHTS